MYYIELSDESKLVLEFILERAKTEETMNALAGEINKLLMDIKVKGTRVGIALDDFEHIHLANCYKLYCGNREWRIVFEAFDDNVIRVHIIGLRDKLMVYTIAHEVRKEYLNKLNMNTSEKNTIE